MQELIGLAAIVCVAMTLGTLGAGLIFKKGWKGIVEGSLDKVFAVAFFTIVLIVTGTYPQ